MKYYTIPINKIKRGSRVVLYGGGKIGKSIYLQNKESAYFDIVAIIDRNTETIIEDKKCLPPEELKNLDFDYVIICVTEDKFGVIYETVMSIVPTILKSKIVYVEIAEKERSNIGNIPVADFGIHWFMEDELYRDKSIDDCREMVTQKSSAKNCNCIDENISLEELFLLCFKLKKFHFHITGKEGKYIGSINHKNLGELGKDLSDIKCAGNIIDIMQKKNIRTDYSVNVSTKIYTLYSNFMKIKLDEIPVVKNNILLGIIKKSDFDACLFQKPTVENEMYMAERYPLQEQPPLNKYGFSVNSQSGEDGILEHVFNVIGFKSHYAVEFGAWDGIYLSNIRNLIVNHNLKTLFIEGDSEKAKDGINNYKDKLNVKFVEEFVGIKKCKKLDQIFSEQNAPSDIDILSIDIDGWDYWVWDSLKNYRPRIVIVEFNPTIYKDVVVINPSDEETRTGSSALAFVELAKRKHYELICVEGANLIFCVEEEFEKFDILDNSLSTLWPVSGIRCLFSTFNGNVERDCWGRNGQHVLDSIN